MERIPKGILKHLYTYAGYTIVEQPACIESVVA